MPRPEPDAIIDDHAERIRAVESRYTDVVSQLAAQSVQIGQLGLDIKNGVEAISLKMDSVVAPLKLVSDAVDEHKRVLKDLKDAEDARSQAKDERKKAVKKWVLGATLAGGGFLAEKVAGWLWTNGLSHLFR